MLKRSLLFLFLLRALLPVLNVSAQSSLKHPDGQYVNVNNTRLWVETIGKGKPLFLIAGGPGSSHLYMHNFDSLADEFTLVFIDNFGRGKSDTTANYKEYSIARDVEDIEGIRRQMGFDKIAILGHSYGAVVAQLYAIKYGENLTHLIIADGFFNGKMWQENDDNSNRIYAENMPEVWDSLMVLRAKGLRSSDKAHFEVYFNLRSGLLYSYNPENAKKFPDDQSYANDFNRHVYYQIVGADGDFKVGNDIALFDVTKQLKDLKMPILIIAGRFDRVSVPRYAVQYKKYCPQARFVMFENSGHSPQVEEPEKEFALIREFMES